jgi:hypothetical protein
VTRIARLLLVTFVILATALLGAPGAVPALADPTAPQAQPAPGTTVKVPFNSTLIGRINNMYRARYRIEPTRNVATFQYVKDGKVYYVTTASVSSLSKGPKVAVFNFRDAQGNLVQVPDKDGKLQDELRVENETINVGPDDTRQTVSGKHSEQLIDMILQAWGIHPDQVQEILTELEPCNLRSNNCSAKVIPTYGNAAVSYYFDYHDAATREQGVKDLESAVEGFYDELDDLQVMFQSTKNQAAAGELANMLAGLGAPPPGGIDFSTLQLRYLSDPSPGEPPGLRYSFSATPGGSSDAAVGRTAALQSSDAFFVWLELTPDKFWVNLNPSEPDRIVDAKLGSTDAGRILLQADLLMKKTVAKLIHPDTPLGKQFWQQLSSSGDQLCLSFRQWIVPAPATVRQDGDSLYIMDAPLEVKLESEYLKERGASTGNAEACPVPDKSIQDHNEQVFRTMILPKVQEAVNTAPEFAELRRVYLSRVAAEWYRQRNAHQATSYGPLIDHDDVQRWPARATWSPRQVFDQYVDSYRNGEFHVTQQHQDGQYVYTNTYVFGGVDFSSVPFDNVTAATFQEKWGNLSQVVNGSLSRPTTDEHGGIWLGSAPKPATTGPTAGSPSTVAAPTSGVSRWWPYAAIVVVLAGFIARRSRRQKRRRRI